MAEVNPRVSVIIPTYKRESKFLSRAILSVKSQTYKNTEIVVVDDNSPASEYRQKTKEFMRQYENDVDVIYIINPKNVGGSLARNIGIHASTGDYITFLDDDDEYLPKKIENQIDFMLTSNCDMSITNLKLMNENKIVVDFREYRNIKSFDKIALLKYHIMRHLTGTPTFMYKAEKLKEIGGFEDAKMGQEFYLMLKSIENDLSIGYLDDCNVIAYRHTSGGISQGKNKINGEKTLYAFKKKYFHLFTFREKMFIRFRHYAVMAVAYKRNKKYFLALWNLIVMFLSSPADLFNEVRKTAYNLIVQRELER